METSKILTADWLDILFDNRNKEYGAYQLRRTYEKRIRGALLVTLLITGFIVVGATLGNSFSGHHAPSTKTDGGYILKKIEEKKPPPVQKPKVDPKPKEPPVKTKMFTEFKPVPDDKMVQPPPSQDDLKNSKIDVFTKDGKDFDGIQDGPPVKGDEKGVVDVKPKEETDGIVQHVEIEAKFIGDWGKFLLRSLNPGVPADNGAPPGRYTVMIQFVVDKEGNVSDIRALTNIGYGLEEEAIRVIKKATKWEPAIQNGYKVKAYRRQPITFEVPEE